MPTGGNSRSVLQRSYGSGPYIQPGRLYEIKTIPWEGINHVITENEVRKFSRH